MLINKHTFVKIVKILAYCFGILLIALGVKIMFQGEIYSFVYSILLNLKAMPILSEIPFFNVADRLFSLRFAPNSSLFGFLILLNGCVFIALVSLLSAKEKSLSALFNYISFSNTNREASRTKSSGTKYHIVLILIFVISTVILFQDFNSEISRLNSFKQTEVASNIYFYIEEGFKIEETMFAKNFELKLFSYPFYQFSAASIAIISGLDTVQAGRLINIILFAMTFFLFIKLFEFLEVKRSMILISMFLFSFSPLVLYYYRAVHTDPMAIFLSFLSLYYFLKYDELTNQLKAGSQIQITRFSSPINYFIISIITGIIAVLIKSPIYLMIVISLIFYRFHIDRLRGIFKRDFIIYLLMMAVSVIFYKISADIINEGVTISHSWMFSTLSGRLSLTHYLLLFTWYIIGVTNPILMIIFVTGIVISIKNISTADDNNLIFISLFIGMFSTVFIFFNVFRAHDYYQLPFVIVVAYFIAFAIDRVLQKIKGDDFSIKKKVLYIYIIAQFVIITLIGLSIFKMPTNPDSMDINSGKFIQQVVEKDAFVFYVMPDEYHGWDPTYLFHAKRNGYNLDFARLNQEGFLKKLIEKYKNRYNEFYVFLPDKYDLLQVKNIDINRFLLIKKSDDGSIYRM